MGKWQSVFLSVVIGFAGTLLCGWMLSGLIGTEVINQGGFGPSVFMVSLLGGIMLMTLKEFVPSTMA